MCLRLLRKPYEGNTAGFITGYYNRLSTTPVVFDIPQGFVRTLDGQITTFGNREP